MPLVTILSPHRDDAVFSLANWMREWCARGIPVKVVNFYTASEYAPWLPSSAVSVTEARAREDRRALLSTHPSISVRSHHLLDAPLRLREEVPAVMGLSPAEVRDQDVVQAARLLQRECRNALVLTPLGLGGHIDHLTIRAAAVRVFPEKRLGFYEDLPYAVWTRPDAIPPGLRVVALKQARVRRRKRSLVTLYRTQVRREDADTIAQYRPAPGISERLWIPERSAAWRRLL